MREAGSIAETVKTDSKVDTYVLYKLRLVFYYWLDFIKFAGECLESDAYTTEFLKCMEEDPKIRLGIFYTSLKRKNVREYMGNKEG